MPTKRLVVAKPVDLVPLYTFRQHVLFNPQLCGCGKEGGCEKCDGKVLHCAFCKKWGWQLGQPCSVEDFPAIMHWGCGSCGIIGVQPIYEPDNEAGVAEAVRKQHKAIPNGCKANTGFTIVRVR